MVVRNDLYQRIDSVTSDILSVIEMMEAAPKMSDDVLQSFKTDCRRIPEQIRSDRIKIAAVGVIKSGKSTLVNAIIGKEVVKRGAGVVTAVTTRICKGRKNRATIFLKSWDDINDTLKSTLELFPEDGDLSWDIDIKTFDLRRKNDRDFLGQVYEKLVRDFPVTDQGVRPETLLIRDALEGYDTCRDMVGPDRQQLIFEGKAFEDHKAFTGDAVRAFFVADVCLELYGRVLDPRVELADCQGADSTDPSQLSRVLDYIQQSNLIIYCISSRTGLRRADMRFLKIIKGLGLFENILFVNNCDLSEHDSLDDLMAVTRRISQDLAFLEPSAEIYSFSALMDLFTTMEKKLCARNWKRLALWQEDSAMAVFCMGKATRFYERFSTLLGEHHHRLLVSNHLERLHHMVTAMEKKAGLSRKMLDADMDGRESAKIRLAQIRDDTGRLKSIVANSIPGAVSGLTREIETHLESAFTEDAIQIRRKITDFIRQAPLGTAPYHSRIRELGVKKIVYMIFQDFRRDLDLFVISQVLPDIKTLVYRQEERVADYFQSLLDSYQIDFLKFSPDMPPTDDGLASQQRNPRAAVDISGIKKILGLTLPSFAISPRYSGRVLTGMGISFVARLFPGLFGKKTSVSLTPGFDAAAQKIKKQTLQALPSQIQRFHVSLKQHYFIPLIKAVTRDFTDKIHERFSFYESLDTDTASFFDLDQAKKYEQIEGIDIITSRLQRIREDILRLK